MPILPGRIIFEVLCELYVSTLTRHLYCDFCSKLGVWMIDQRFYEQRELSHERINEPQAIGFKLDLEEGSNMESTKPSRNL